MGNLQKNNCCDCDEGYVFGKNVYCNIDGKFHPLRDEFICKDFIQKDSDITTNDQKEKARI